MKLKTLISIKFIALIITFFCIVYLIGNVTDSYKSLEKQNNSLLEQKKYYEEILQNPQAKEELLKIIRVYDNALESETGKEEFSINANIWILVIFWMVASYIFNILNSKIDKLKSEENESEKDTFL